MSDYCPKCFETMDFLHTCQGSKSEVEESFSQSSSPKKEVSLANIVGFAPLGGLLVEYLIPLPSSIAHSIFISLIGSTLVGVFWALFIHRGNRNINYILANLKNFAYAPNMLKIYSHENPKKATRTWLAILALSTALQIVIFTPGNAAYLSRSVTNKIDDASGANLKVSCPSNFLYFYNDKIECRVKTGILGISVPARSKLSPISGSAEIKVSLF